MKYAIAAFAALSWTAVSVSAQACQAYGQCGGATWTGCTTCPTGYVCGNQSQYYAQCIPGSGGATTTTTKAASITTTTKAATTTTTQAATTTTTGAACPTATSGGSGTLSNTGVNIAGFDFGCGTDGTCSGAGSPPLASLGGADGLGQMTHFVAKGMNTFRLPVAWQGLTPTLGGTLDPTYWTKYDALVQACLGTGAYCIIDIHNYARWNGNIIGQSNGAVTNAHFASLWSQIATKYATKSKVIFGLMNEPHDVPDINAWAVSVQAAVTAIRNAGATSQQILLPGNNWTSAEAFITNGSGAALSTVKNVDGSVTNLIFDVHKYLDSDYSGTHAECVDDNVTSTFLPLSQWLRCNGRKAFVTETGGGNVASCLSKVCTQNRFLKANSDVFLGYVGWAAGSFATSYVLAETPTNNGGTWTDQTLVSTCMYQSAL